MQPDVLATQKRVDEKYGSAHTIEVHEEEGHDLHPTRSDGFDASGLKLIKFTSV